MKVNLLLFASIREAVGTGSIALDIPEGETVEGLIAALAERYPAVSEHLPSVKIAVNRDLARSDTVLRAGDEVALLPPVGGG